MNHIKRKAITTNFLLTMLIIICTTCKINADDNADTGSGGTNGSTLEKGHYNYAEYMYKVSVFVGLSDTVDETSSLSEWKMIADQFIYLKPAEFTLAVNTLGGTGAKVNYLSGKTLQSVIINQVLVDDPPPIPITNGGNINSVKSYFGDTQTLNALIDGIAYQQHVTRNDLISSLEFIIEGKKMNYPPEVIFPVKENGIYQNKVPWLIMYEPVIITYLKDNVPVLAFTATEYALAQKLGYFNFKSGSDGQYVSAMTHSDLPNSVFLEESWIGYLVTPALPDGVYWSDDRIISGGGWGMRMLKPDSLGVVENNTSYDYEYRVDTDVITSVRIYADADITPDNRDESETTYKNPMKATATVTMSANGYTKSTEIVIPKGGSELVWLKWHTPLSPDDVSIHVEVTGNQAAKIDGKNRSDILIGKVVDLKQNIPPNPTATDENKNFTIPKLLQKADKKTAEWGTYTCTWVPDWNWQPKWVWESDWQLVPHYHLVDTMKGPEWQTDGMVWEDQGEWVDQGKWIDEGNWEYDYTNYYATLSANMLLKPDAKAPTADGNMMKSGYGVNIDIGTKVYTNAPSNHLTYVQNTITYFPEFQYKNYWRVLDQTSYGNFKFEKNKYSTYNNRTHFTPIWYPDGKYEVYAEVIDLWTPEGMLRMNLSDEVTINGNLFSDWHISPK